MADEENTLSLSVFGQSAAAKGTSAIIILVLLAFAGGLGFLLWDRSNDDRLAQDLLTATLSAHVATMQTDHAIMNAAAERAAEAAASTSRQLKIQNYIILLDPDEKKDVKRRMVRPAELQ